MQTLNAYSDSYLFNWQFNSSDHLFGAFSQDQVFIQGGLLANAFTIKMINDK